MLHEPLTPSQPAFVGGRRRGLLRRFRCAAHAVDSTVIQLVANCMPWAKHRRRKAAAKLHVRLNLQSLLPSCAIIKTAAEHDNTRAVEVCAGLQEGESVIFDKAYVWFVHLWQLTQRGVFWVSRPKDNLDYRVKRRRIKKPQGKILRDDEIVLRGVKSKQDYPGVLRRVVALVTLDGVEQEMAFLTNNLTWSAQTIAELYRCRWDREVLPANQADAATGRLRGQQRERGEMADLDGPAVVCVAALPGFPEFLGLRVHPALGYLPFGGLGKNRPAGSIARLWDSSTAAAVKGGGAPGLFARPGAQTVRRLWDSIGFAYDGGDDEQAEKVLKYVGSLAGNTPRFPQEFWGRCPSYTFLWDATVLDFEF